MSDWTRGGPRFEKRDLPHLIHALGAGPVLSRKHRDQIAGLLKRLRDECEPFVQKRRGRGRPRKSFLNFESVSAEHVVAEYVLALCVEGGWGAKPNALCSGVKLARRLFPGHNLSKRDIDDAFRRYKTADIIPRPSKVFEDCPANDGRQLKSGNPTIEAYREALIDDVAGDPEQQALGLRDKLREIATSEANRIAASLAPQLAMALRASFAKRLRDQFEADFAEALRPELDDEVIESFLLRLSALLPEALSAVATLDVAKENPAR